MATVTTTLWPRASSNCSNASASAVVTIRPEATRVLMSSCCRRDRSEPLRRPSTAPLMKPQRPICERSERRSSGHGIAGIRAKAAHICGVAYTPEGLVDVFAKQRECWHPTSKKCTPASVLRPSMESCTETLQPRFAVETVHPMRWRSVGLWFMNRKFFVLAIKFAVGVVTLVNPLSFRPCTNLVQRPAGVKF